ncbi:MAG: CoA-binding protein [Candidatus Thermoplasmatota archaeon]|nr:CoA-binding protein [Candidatus Thermoplasmatota archaeon]
MKQDLSVFFKPKSIAVVGASKDSRKIGHAALKNILISDYPCKLYPINPKEDQILGLKCYKSLLDVPGTIDLVLVSVPAALVPNIMKDCVQKKVKFTIIISSGFSEIGNHELEQEVEDIIKGTSMRVLGPNTMGFKNASDNLDASFVFGVPRKGNLSLISQSGALGIGMIYLANNEFVGVSKIIGVGNKLDIDDDDLIEFFSHDPDTKVIGLYIEAVKDGRAFMNAIKACDKPVLVVKAGRSSAGARATASHTGSMAGSDKIYSAAIKQAGGIRCRDIVELFDMARGLAGQPAMKGNRVGIITNGGGLGILLTDACEENGLVVPKLSAKTAKRIDEIIPDIVKPNNPVDLVADAGFFRYESATKILLEDPNIDGIIVASVHGGYARPREFTGAILKMVREKRLHETHQKPILGTWVGGTEFEELVFDLKSAGVPIYPSSWRTARSMYALYVEGQRLKREALQKESNQKKSKSK